MKLALVISSLAGGGAERVMTTLANGWAASGVEVTLITLAAVEIDEYELSPDVRRVSLALASDSEGTIAAVTNNGRRIFALRRAIGRWNPELVVSFIDTTNMLCILACLGLGIPVVVSDRVAVTESPPRSVWKWLYRPLYRRAAAVVVQTLRGAAEVRRRTGREAVVIPNPLQPSDSKSKSKSESGWAPAAGAETHTILAMGRLVPQKGFDLLIEAFARVASVHSGWRVVILGEGAERANLTAAIRTAGLADRVFLGGFTSEPRQAMRQSDLFALPSRFEGFPNGLLEAMAEGMPCISCDCPTGPRELIEHGTNGWLVPAEDVEALAMGLDLLMGHADLRLRLGAQARGVRQSYSLAAILDKWNRLIESVVERRAPRILTDRDGDKAGSHG